MSSAAPMSVPHSQETQFVFICGPVGCGNSFLFRCLTEDTANYGIDEADLGGVLHRLAEPQRNIERCPHAPEAFVNFMHGLASDRQTFIDKTPSNVRHQSILRETLNPIHFLFTVREPRAALVSALSGRSLVNDVEHVARLWRADCELIASAEAGDITVIYDEFVRDPAPTLDRIAEHILPLGDDVYRFADRMIRPDRSDASRWRNRVDDATAEHIEYWVRELELDALSESFHTGQQPSSETLPTVTAGGSMLQRARAQLFNAYYRGRSR